jgi:hypothetical protein
MRTMRRQPRVQHVRNGMMRQRLTTAPPALGRTTLGNSATPVFGSAQALNQNSCNDKQIKFVGIKQDLQYWKQFLPIKFKEVVAGKITMIQNVFSSINRI